MSSPYLVDFVFLARFDTDERNQNLSKFCEQKVSLYAYNNKTAVLFSEMVTVFYI